MRNLGLITFLIFIHCFCYANKNILTKKHWSDKVEYTLKVNEVVSNLEYFNLSNFDHLIQKKAKQDELGFTHYAYNQHHKNIVVENATIALHEKAGKVEFINGSTVHNFDKQSIPAISENLALKNALNFVNAKQYVWEIPEFEETLCKSTNTKKSTFYPTGELVWHKSTDKDDDSSYKINYKFDIYSIQPDARQYIYVDATSGEITESINRITNCAAANVTAETNYNGIVNMNVCKENGEFYLTNLDDIHIEVFDAAHNHITYENEIKDIDNYFEHNKAANEVFYTSQKIYNYFKNNFGRNSIDDEGMPILSWVNYANRFGNKNDAFWNGNWMFFGGGDGNNFNSLTSIDIVAHEMMHAITEFSANLIYKNESGALNESFSDIFGEVIEFYTKGTTDWLVGADIVARNNKTALRNLKNTKDGAVIYQQPNTYKGVNWWTDKEDFGGVHYNSGVQNYWFYLLAEGGNGVNDNGHSYTIEPIGIDKAAAIAYRNLVYYLTPTAIYKDAKNGAIQAANDLYGVNSFEAQQTELAWQAVGIGEQNNIECNSNLDSLMLLTVISNFEQQIDVSGPINNWRGITVNTSGCVTAIDWDDCCVRGGVLAPEIWNLKSLERLYITENGVEGTIPPQIGNLTNLVELGLWQNKLSGTIPIEIGNLTNLIKLDIGANKLSGTIPIELGNLINLEFLAIGQANLTGTIPPELGNLSKLKILSLSGNNLTGSFTKELSNLTSLTYFELLNNNLNGCYDSSLSILCDNLSHGNNNFISNGNNFDASWEDFCDSGAGTCVENISCRTSDSLNLMILSDYIFEPGWDKDKPINQWPGIQLNENRCIVSIVVGENTDGTLPPEIGHFTQLETLSIFETDLTGSIPPEIGQLTNLTYLDLGESDFTGEIPPEIGNLVNLTYLDIAENNLVGQVPFTFKNLVNLIDLDIGNQGLSGTVNEQLSNCKNLTKLRIASSQINGNIEFINDMPNLKNASIIFNNFSGDLNRITNYNLEFLDLRGNKFDGELPLTLLLNLNGIVELTYNNFSGCYPEAAKQLCSKYNKHIISQQNNFDVDFDSFCNTGAGTCELPAIAIWPGDMDNNGIVNSNDLLYFGLAFGNTGSTRANATTLWQAQQATYWDNTVAGVNGVYQDANGDGIVNLEDFAAIEQNFGKTHQINNVVNNVSPVSLQLELESLTKQGEEVELIYNLYATYADGVAPNIYGLSASINLSDLPVREVTTDFIQSSLGSTEHFAFFNNTTGLLDIALTRTDQANIKATNSLARFIVIIDDVPTGDPYRITIGSGNFSTVSGGLSGIKSSNFYNRLYTNPGVNSNLTVYLNTSNDFCNLSGTATIEITSGVAPYSILWSNGLTGATIDNLAAGAYSAYVSDAIGNVQELQFVIYSNPPVYDQDGTLICGTACPDYLLPVAKPDKSILQSANIIEANCSYIDNDNISYRASNSVILNKGFYVAPGVDFSADIGDCY